MSRHTRHNDNEEQNDSGFELKRNRRDTRGTEQGRSRAIWVWSVAGLALAACAIGLASVYIRAVERARQEGLAEGLRHGAEPNVPRTGRDAVRGIEVARSIELRNRVLEDRRDEVVAMARKRWGPSEQEPVVFEAEHVPRLGAETVLLLVERLASGPETDLQATALVRGDMLDLGLLPGWFFHAHTKTPEQLAVAFAEHLEQECAYRVAQAEVSRMPTIADPTVDLVAAVVPRCDPKDLELEGPPRRLIVERSVPRFED